LIFADFETFSFLDIRKVGSAEYVRHSSTEALLLAYAYDDGPVEVWDCTEDVMPAELEERIQCAESLDNEFGVLEEDAEKIVFHNAAFDHGILENKLMLYIPPERLIDTMAMALRLGYPPGLDDLAAALNLKGKLASGRRLIQKFCKPRRPSKHNHSTRNLPADFPEDWQTFIDYAKRDVEVMRHCCHKLRRLAL
jgi:DNA polymerase